MPWNVNSPGRLTSDELTGLGLANSTSSGVDGRHVAAGGARENPLAVGEKLGVRCAERGREQDCISMGKSARQAASRSTM